MAGFVLESDEGMVGWLSGWEGRPAGFGLSPAAASLIRSSLPANPAPGGRVAAHPSPQT